MQAATAEPLARPVMRPKPFRKPARRSNELSRAPRDLRARQNLLSPGRDSDVDPKQYDLVVPGRLTVGSLRGINENVDTREAHSTKSLPMVR